LLLLASGANATAAFSDTVLICQQNGWTLELNFLPPDSGEAFKEEAA
jgi:hypothetical protein